MKKINFKINGSTVTAFEGQTILEAAKENDIFIPTLCNDERVKPFGSCLLCRVEVEGARGNMLACATPVTEGMVVRTEGEEINNARKMCLELLVSQHYGDCKAPCSLTCPAEIDVQGYIAHIANGEYKEAIKLIKERNPLPLVCGRVCTRPCENECRRNLVDDRVGIDYLKRFVSDYDLYSDKPYTPEVLPRTGKKVAVIGAGPSGLTCSYYLAALGHEVTIFEKWPKGGGMLRYGIPEYRLPRNTLQKEIELIEKLGVEIRYNTTFGRDISYLDLKKDGYDALFLGVGSQVGQPLGIENEKLEGVMTGVEFLGKVNLTSDIDFTGKKVVVIGGGNTAVDAARTSLRLNASEVILAYRRTKAEMPAHEMEIEEAEYEGVKLELLVAPKAIKAVDGSLCGVEFVKMQLGKPDASGRRKPEEVQGSEFIMETDIVIAAIGQTQDLSFINVDFNLASNRNRIIINEDVMTTNLDGVFAGGDAVTGPDTAISAIAAGRRAAFAINQYLKGEEIKIAPKVYNHTKGKLKDINPNEFADFEKKPKEKMPMLSKEERKGNFKEVELGFSEEQARKEAMRCLSCGCMDVNECKLRNYATKYEAKQSRLMGEIELHPIDESHEFITRDPNKCIMCGLCVRICMEQQGEGVFGFNARGYSTVITPSFEVPFGEDNRCGKCGQCVSACPVGALVEKTTLAKSGPFVEAQTETTCAGCGTGCSTVLSTAGSQVVRVTAKTGVGVNNGNLCEKGRFKALKDMSLNNFNEPLIRKNGEYKTVTWDEAYDFIGDRLKTINSLFGNNSIGVLVTPNMTNEELEITKKLATDILKTDNYGSLNISDAALGLKKATNKEYGNANYSDMNKSDFIVCAGFDIKETNPVAALFVKKAAENGSKVVIIAEEETKLARFASKNLIISTKEIISLLKDYKGFLYEEFNSAKKPMFIIGDKTDIEIAEAIGKFIKEAENENSSILLMHDFCNMRGLIEEGFNRSFDPKEVKAIISVGDGDTKSNTFDELEFQVACSSNIDLTQTNADVILPLLGYYQNQGAFTNSEGNIGIINNAFNSQLKYSNTEVIENIIEVLK